MVNFTTILLILATAFAAYLLGSVNFAVIVSRLLYHDDVRKYGSKNAGMTNMLRVYGKKAATLTALGDFGKGVLSVVAVSYTHLDVYKRQPASMARMSNPAQAMGKSPTGVSTE